jgi:biopolymer transport protein ExbB
VSAAQFLTQGGPVMLVLLLMSVAALAIVLLKSYQFLRLGLRRVQFVETAIGQLVAGRITEARRELGAVDHPVARTMEAAIASSAPPSESSPELRAEVERVGASEIRNLESWLRGLSSIAHLSPLLGLLGTVLGMISAFMRIEQAGSAIDPAILSGGIWEALLTTAFGLTVAIPSMAAFHVLEGEVDRVRAAMKDASARVFTLHARGTGAETEHWWGSVVERNDGV